MSFTPRTQIGGKTALLLLDLDYQGQIYRFTTSPQQVTVLDEDGVERVYIPGMQTAEVSLEAGQAFTGFQVSIASGAVDWALLRARGARLDLSAALLRLWYEGQTLEQADPLIIGRVVTPNFGDIRQPLSFGIERQLVQRGTIPDPSMRIDSETWPVRTPDYDLDAAAVGFDYQIPIGFPGSVDGDFAAPTVPVYMVELGHGVFTRRMSRAMVSGLPVHATEVTLHNVSQGTATTLNRPVGGVVDLTTRGPWVRPVFAGVDKLGKPVALIDFDDPSIPPPTPDTQYKASFDRTVAGVRQGGIPNALRDGPLVGAGEIIQYLLTEWSDIEIDIGRMESQAAALNAYKLSLVLGGRSSVWDFIRQRLAPLLPVEWRTTNRGGYYQVLRLGADRRESVFDLIATPGDPARNCSRMTGLQSTGGEIRNRITVEYGEGGQQGAPMRAVIIDAEDDPNDDRVVGDYVAKWSQSRFSTNKKTGKVTPRDMRISASVVGDRSTALLIGQDKLLERAIPRAALRVEGGPGLNSLDINAVGTFTDASVHIDHELVLLRRKVIAGRTVSAALLLLEDPLKATVSTV